MMNICRHRPGICAGDDVLEVNRKQLGCCFLKVAFGFERLVDDIVISADFNKIGNNGNLTGRQGFF